MPSDNTLNLKLTLHHVFDTPLDVDVHDAVFDQQQIDQIHAVVLRLRATSRRMRQAIAAAMSPNVPYLTEGESMSAPATVQEALDQLTATEADENAAAVALIAAYATVPAQIKAAVDAALAKGATDEQLSAFNALRDKFAADAAAMKAALATPVT